MLQNLLTSVQHESTAQVLAILHEQAEMLQKLEDHEIRDALEHLILREDAVLLEKFLIYLELTEERILYWQHEVFALALQLGLFDVATTFLRAGARATSEDIDRYNLMALTAKRPTYEALLATLESFNDFDEDAFSRGFNTTFEEEIRIDADLLQDLQDEPETPEAAVIASLLQETTGTDVGDNALDAESREVLNESQKSLLTFFSRLLSEEQEEAFVTALQRTSNFDVQLENNLLLRVATRKRCLQAIDALLQAGANPYDAPLQAPSAVELAAAEGDEELAALVLQSFGAVDTEDIVVLIDEADSELSDVAFEKFELTKTEARSDEQCVTDRFFQPIIVQPVEPPMLPTLKIVNYHHFQYALGAQLSPIFAKPICEFDGYALVEMLNGVTCVIDLTTLMVIREISAGNSADEECVASFRQALQDLSSLEASLREVQMRFEAESIKTRKILRTLTAN